MIRQVLPLLLALPALVLSACSAPAEVAQSVASTALSGGPSSVVVREVVDGDTLDVSIDGEVRRLRLIGVDTPEVHGQVECYGREASDRTKALAPPGTPVRLEKDVSETDQYGRLLRYVYLPDGRMLNEVLVREGYAQVATFPPDVRYQDRFLDAQRQAREEGAGLWGRCRDGAAAPRETPPTPAASAAAGHEPCAPGQIKGNRNSGVYHAPGQRDYARTTANVECFDSEAEAQAAGYRKASR
ncbi:MAG TPA: thermonuclease family protein [Chloroflexota bacterium]